MLQIYGSLAVRYCGSKQPNGAKAPKWRGGGADWESPLPQNEDTPLLAAVEEGHSAVVDALLLAGEME